jgi:hypothetical protein
VSLLHFLDSFIYVFFIATYMRILIVRDPCGDRSEARAWPTDITSTPWSAR